MTAEPVSGDHGRIEVRRAWATDDLVWLATHRRWPGLRSVLRVDSARTVGDHTTHETRCVVSSLPPGWDHDCLLRVIMGAKNFDALALLTR